MCYSAMVETSLRAYRRMTGAEIDLPQFLEIFGLRAAGVKVTIPRAVERWFDQPQSPVEREIADLIRAYRSAQTAELERELFAQRKRLADAERKLAVKPTKAAAESRRIATDKSSRLLERLQLLSDAAARASDGRIFPFHYAPIIIADEGTWKVRLARYHCRLAGKPAGVDQQFPGLYNARRDNIERYWRDAFGSDHALMLTQSFFENVQRDGRNAVLHFTPKPAETIWVACLYSRWRDVATGDQLLSFAAITDEPPAEVAAAGHDRMIVNLEPRNAAAWLSPQGRSAAELQAVLSERPAFYFEHEVLAA